jgi:hypothetical protein
MQHKKVSVVNLNMVAYSVRVAKVLGMKHRVFIWQTGGGNFHKLDIEVEALLKQNIQQYTYNVTLRHVLVTVVVVEQQ